MAAALGVEAVRAGRSVYFSPLADIIDSLAKADREGRLRERIRYLGRSSLLIIDEIGYLAVGAGAGNLFFQLVNARYEKGAMILDFEPRFRRMGEVFGELDAFTMPLFWIGWCVGLRALSSRACSGDSEICQGMPLASCLPVSHPLRSQSNMTCGVMPMAAAAP